MARPRRAGRGRAADPMVLMNLLAGKWVSQAMGVVAELGIPDVLGNRAKSAAELARATTASEAGLYRLLRALASVGLVVETGRRRFRLTPLGQLLRRDALGGYARFTGHESTWRAWGALRHSVRTGDPAFDHIFAMPVFEYFAKAPDAAAVFDAAMTSISTVESRAVVAAYDFAGTGTLVDVAGGQGLLIATILSAKPKMRGILFDRPHVTAGAPALLQSHGLADRCQILSGDFFAAVSEGGDAYIMKHIIHDWDDERATRILRTCHRAMPSGGKLLIAEAVIPPGNGAHFGKLLDLEMLVLTPRGRERTRAEFQALLTRSGFRLRRVVPTATHLSLVEGVKA